LRQVEVAGPADVKPGQPTLWGWLPKKWRVDRQSHTIVPAKPGCNSMTTIKSIFFDIGDTLGIPAFSPPPVRLVRVDLFFFVAELLRSLSDRGLRLGIISNTGDIDGARLDETLNAAGVRDFFDPALRLYSKDVGLEKNSPEIFLVATERAGLAATPQACLFVGENETERGFASDAGLRTCPHPLLVSGVLGDSQAVAGGVQVVSSSSG
jgi:hypothetical protein